MQFIFFSFLVWLSAFCVLFKKSCLLYGHFLLFYPRSFIILLFTFKSLIHFEIIFMYGVRSSSRSIFFFPDRYHFLQYHLLKSDLLCTFMANQVAAYVHVYFWTLFVPLLYLSILAPKYYFYEVGLSCVPPMNANNYLNICILHIWPSLTFTMQDIIAVSYLQILPSLLSFVMLWLRLQIFLLCQLLPC